MQNQDFISTKKKMKLLLVVIIVVTTIAVNICDTNALPLPHPHGPDNRSPAVEGSYLIPQPKRDYPPLTLGHAHIHE